MWDKLIYSPLNIFNQCIFFLDDVITAVTRVKVVAITVKRNNKQTNMAVKQA